MARKFKEYEQEQKDAILSFFRERRTYSEVCAFFTENERAYPDYKKTGDIIDALLADGTLTEIQENRRRLNGGYFTTYKYVLNSEAE